MPKWICKVTRSGAQHRLTLPRGLLKDMRWDDVRVVTLQTKGETGILIRRFIDGESLKDEGKGDKS